MTMAVLTWLIAIPLLGAVTGLRAMTAMMVLCWFAYQGHLPVDGTWAFWTERGVTAIVFTVLAIGEYIGDKLPNTPARTAPVGLISRIVIGGLIGAIAATSLEGSGIEGVLLGVAGAVIGTFAGYQIRKGLVEGSGWKDWHVAVAEDVFAIVAAVLAMGVVTG
jgi:uncharacterized membrane protein